MKFLSNVPSKSWVIFFSAVIICLLSILKPLNNYELLFLDLRFKLRPPLDITQDIIVIEISDDTLRNLKNWPLPRDFHASLVDVLKEEGAKIIVFDILFSEPTQYDDVFSVSIKNAGNVYLPLAYYVHQPQRGDRLPFKKSALLADLCRSLKDYAAGVGHINVFVDGDGKTRTIPLFIKDGDQFVPSLGLKAAADWLGLDMRNLEFKRGRVTIDNKLSPPVLENGGFVVNYPDKWSRSFKHFSYFEILKSYSEKKRGIKPTLDLSVIKDKACFIGLTAVGTSDLRATPLENICPMLGLQASVFNSLLNRKFIRDTGLIFTLLINLAVFFLSLYACLKLAPLRAFLANSLLGLLYFLISLCLFIVYGLWIDLFLPILIIFFTYTCSTFYRFIDENKKRQLLEKELDIARAIQRSFLPAEISNFHGLDISSFLQPAKFVAGDLYDVFVIDERKIGVFIGDVSGKGVPAALIMAQTISLFRIFSRQYPNSPEVLNRMNREFYGKFSGRFVTCMYIIIDIEKKQVSVSSAGHSPLLLHRRGEERILEIELSADLPLGITEDIEYKEVIFNMEEGDEIIVFTDGLSEARDKRNQEFGLANIKNIILKSSRLTAAELSKDIESALFGFSGRQPLHDDITFIVLKSQE
ncbi:MAG: CHASE2 domain-containing protein [Candidatus Omnitrophica bacterium]|nr:CHASE2 domain-containing protein [Candidatus Omnitrophota bacterium]